MTSPSTRSAAETAPRERSRAKRLPGVALLAEGRAVGAPGDLAERALSALAILLRGLEAAARRDGRELLLDTGDSHSLYKGLLAVVLRIVFLLYAEDRGMLPANHPAYSERLSVLGLFERLRAGETGRLGAWEHLGRVFGAIHAGVELESLSIPAMGGALFDPEARALDALDKSAVADEAVLRALEALILVEGRRLSYRALDIEQFGSVYEALMGYRVLRTGAGELELKPGAERRRTGAHYTPRSLSEPVVKKTLEPLLAVMGEAPSSSGILDLMVCDPAMGSGAFLIEACRFLSDQVVEAWAREGVLQVIEGEHGDARLHARRLVAGRCLVGVDKNAEAVELAKLSLWLFVGARDLPFTFVDHALRHGDSLVGVDLDQIERFHWKAAEPIGLLRKELNAALARDPGDLVKAIERVRLIGDLLVGAFFSKRKPKDREAERKRRLHRVIQWLEAGGEPPGDLHAMQAELRAHVPAFHWMIELPEIFHAERRDPQGPRRTSRAAFLDAFIGNPPFAGKNAINQASGPVYIQWLRAAHPGSHGAADLSAHFFRRAEQLLGEHGTIGLIATNTIAEGDTRATALQWLLRRGAVIYDATRSTPWPGGASVSVAVVHLAKGTPKTALQNLRLDGRPVRTINSRLLEAPERPDPLRLAANADLCFQGSIVLGAGFMLTPEERDRLVSLDARNDERIVPYIGGGEINTSPAQEFRRYVINFGQIGLDEADRWPHLIAHLREKVKPERDTKNRGSYRRSWWLFAEHRPGLFAAVSRVKRCLVNAQVSKHLVFAFQPPDRVFANTLYVYAPGEHSLFAVLQSRAHEPWARLLSSSLEDRLRYSPSDCFENFPFPEPDPRAQIPSLDEIGRQLYDFRAQAMIEASAGLTITYNRLNDPACQDRRIIELRRLHEAMDREVLRAYGWDDIPVPPYCPASAGERRAAQAFEAEIIDRLFVLNAKRAQEERAARSIGFSLNAAGAGDYNQRLPARRS